MEITRTQAHENPVLLSMEHLGAYVIHSLEEALWHGREVAIAHVRRLYAQAADIGVMAEMDPAEMVADMRHRIASMERILLQASEGLAEPRPVTTSLPGVRPFDPLWLPASLRPWISDVAERMQCPPDYPAVAAMCALSSIAGRRFCIRPKERDQSWYEFPTLWAMLIGRPSLMKSPAMQAVLRPVRTLERVAGDLYEETERERQTHLIQSRFERGMLESKAKAAARTGGKFDYSALLPDNEDPAARRRFIVNDASLEALGEVLRDNPMGTLLYQDELAGLLGMIEKDGNQALRAFLLQAWSGKEGFTFDRITRGMRRVEHCCIALLGSIQPGVIASSIRAANGNEAGSDGFLQRFSLMVWPDMPEDWKAIDRPLCEEAQEAAHRVFAEFEHRTSHDFLQLGARPGIDGIPTFQFDATAQSMFNEWHRHLETRLRRESLPHALESHLAKYRKLVPALAVLLHVADGGGGAGVGCAAFARAVCWAEYLESHATRVYTGDVAAQGEIAGLLLNKLLHSTTRLPAFFTARQIYRKGWSGLTRAEDVESACEKLVDHHWLYASPVPAGEKGGRSTFIYHLNPLAKKAA